MQTNVTEIQLVLDTVKCIVEDCLNTYDGGEEFFNHLDDALKNDKQLISTYLDYITNKEKCRFIIASGELGNKLLQYQQEGILPKYLHILVVEGDLRRDKLITRLSEGIVNGLDYIFFDDSYYSGKTEAKVKQAVQDNGGRVRTTYVVYDGCKARRTDVHSLYRYYG